MVGWHHRLNGYEFGWTPGVVDGQGGLVCCSSWGCRVGHDWATELNWTEQLTISLWAVVLEKTLESPLDYKEIKQVNPKGNKPGLSIGRTDAEASTFWPPGAKSWLIRKGPASEKDWRQEEKGLMEDEMGGWHHELNGHEFEKAPGDGEGQGRLMCCSPWDCRVRHDWATEQQPPTNSKLCHKLCPIETSPLPCKTHLI